MLESQAYPTSEFHRIGTGYWRIIRRKRKSGEFDVNNFLVSANLFTLKFHS